MKTASFHRGLLLLAGLLLSLHSLVPHVHGEQLICAGEASAGNIPAPDGGLLSLLQHFFTNTDLGEDHLEHFASDNDAALSLGVVSTLPPATFPVFSLAPVLAPSVIRRQRVFRSRHFPPSGVYPDNAAPRGPPVFA